MRLGPCSRRDSEERVRSVRGSAPGNVSDREDGPCEKETHGVLSQSGESSDEFAS